MAVLTTLALNKGVSAETYASIKEYLKTFGSGSAMFVRFDGRYLIHVHDPADLQKMRMEFGEFIDSEKASL